MGQEQQQQPPPPQPLIKGPNQVQQIPDTKLIAHISTSHQWMNQLTSGKSKSIKEIANQEKVSTSYVSKVIDCGLLAPDIVRSILNGKQPADLNLEKLRKLIPLPIDWEDQKNILGMQ